MSNVIAFSKAHKSQVGKSCSDPEDELVCQVPISLCCLAVAWLAREGRRKEARLLLRAILEQDIPEDGVWLGETATRDWIEAAEFGQTLMSGYDLGDEHEA